MILFDYLKTPIGIITLEGSTSHLKRIHFKKVNLIGTKASKNSVVGKAKAQLAEYFEGKRVKFEIPLDLEGTEFQLLVWKNLKKIPFGKLASYGGLAKKMGKAKASRAVGGANNKNPIPIIIPCHRVVGAGGDLTGFAPGLKAKRFLLELEGHSIHKNSLNFK